MANNYPTDSDILSEEESNASVKIAQLKNKKTDITQKIKDLGIIQKPNITGYLLLLILISVVLICIFSVITIPIIIIDLAVYLFILKKMKKKYEKWELASDALIQELNEIEYGLKKAKAKFKSIQTIRREVLLHLFHTELGFPIRTLKDWEYVDARQKYLKLKTKKEELAQMPASAFKTDLRIAFFNDKLLLFLEKSIQHEAITTESLQMFQKTIADNIQKEIRKDLSFKQLKPDFINTLRNDNETMGVFLNELIANFNEALEMDTSGLFCKHDSSLVEKQTNELETIYKNTIELANEYTHSLSILNEALGICRLVAYRNIYLGAELLNIVRDNAGGGKLTVASDTINYSTFNLDFSIQTEEYSLDESVNQVLTASCDAVIQFVEIGMKDKNLRKYASKNPKHAVAAVATVATFTAIKAGLDAWDKRNAKIESLLKKDEIIFENMERVITHIEGLQSLFERAVEMITALVKCGQGFRTIYDQLYPRIFIDKNFSTISMKELQELALAIGEYKKISDSKL